ncbi:hypothetical protein DFJ63DRAFT_156465 [Scheffersomyces coipomensis]|uniref:uncharacterized protein n=1 Tax=Scheffersomyces coipomensis TaxID=1788519 RepID=UPI00315DBC08
MVRKTRRGGFNRSGANSAAGQKNRKRKSKGTSNNHKKGYSGGNVLELMDEESNIFIPKTTMKALSKRPGRLIDEVKYTENHQDETFGKALRNKPIEFVKAKEVYDPSADLLKKVKEAKEVKEVESQEIIQDELEADEEVDELPELEDVEEFQEDEDISSVIEVETEETIEEDFSEQDQQDMVKNLTIQDIKDNQKPKPVILGMIIDEKGDSKLADKDIIPPTTIEAQPTELEYDSTISIGKVSMTTVRDKYGNMEVELPLTSKHDIDAEQRDALYREYIANVIHRMQQDSDEEEDDGEELDDDQFEMYEEPESSKVEEGEEEDDEEEEEEEETDPEYGFLPEDYEFDISKISVTNLRYGIKNQYYTRCLDITGSDDESMWIDEDEIIEYALSNGVKEHRIKSFLKFITANFLDDSKPNEEDYDVYISDSSEEEDNVETFEQPDNDSEDQDDDLDALISYAKTSKNQDFLSLENSNPSFKVNKKGAKFDNYNLDDELRASLIDQYEAHRLNRRDKKQIKKDLFLQGGADNHDLRVIYPFSLHIKEIKQEFEEFLHDTDRQSISFPPLDPHGNKTVTKMATLYNLKSLKCGNRGLNQFIKASKSRRTFHYLPKYDQINHMLKQRPIFNRTDQKRTKEEIDASNGGKTSRRGGDSSKAVLKEGDIVGGKAPQIDSNNIGRQLLEKLGWTEGEGLGALGNKGISEPVMAKIKKSKVGIK